MFLSAIKQHLVFIVKSATCSDIDHDDLPIKICHFNTPNTQITFNCNVMQSINITCLRC